MKKSCICLDIGGTEIKAASIDEQGGLRDRIRYFAARAEEEPEVWLEYVADIVKICGSSDADSKNICMAFPGPFDYAKGICLMQGLGKYDKLYGVNLRKELAVRLEAEEKDILFMNDAAAFALGEMRFGKAADGAAQCFLAFGQRVRDALLPFLDTFQPEVLCFGGQITGSSPFFLPPVEEACRKRKIRLLVTEDTSLRTLQGLASMADEEALESSVIG